jgi:hypothetical protein
MNSRMTETIWKALRPVLECLTCIALFALIAESAAQIYAVIVKPLVTSRSLDNIFWITASVAGLIPCGIFIIYCCILLVTYGYRTYKYVFSH